MKKFDLRKILSDCYKDALYAIGISICLLFMDGRILLFFVTLAILLSTCVGLAFYRNRKMSKKVEEHSGLIELERLSIAMENESSLDGLVRRATSIGIGDETIRYLQSDDLDDVHLPGRCSDLFVKLVNAFKENNKDAICDIHKEIVDRKIGYENSVENVKFKKSLGSLMAFLISLPLVYLPHVTIVSEAMDAYDWLALLLRMVSVLTFMFVEFMGSSERGLFRKGRAI